MKNEKNIHHTPPDTGFESPHLPRVQVLLPRAISTGAYTYIMPSHLAHMDVQIGTFVQVPLGKQYIVGVVWDTSESPPIAPEKLKPIQDVYTIPPLPPHSIQLIHFISAYYIQPLGAVLKMALPCEDAITKPKTTVAYTIENPPPQSTKITAKRQIVLDALHTSSTPIPLDILQSITGVQRPVIRAMETAQLIMAQTIPCMESTPPMQAHTPPTCLNREQKTASNTIIQASGTFTVLVLDGVTGSGKTETYFEAIAHTLHQGKNVLVLLPEIALSTQWEKRFLKRFGFTPPIWHSEITPAKRRDIWTGVLHGAIAIVVGARSALHLPFDNLGLIIVDEEHDTAYKQQDTVLYNARDMAIIRAKHCVCPVVLVSATPSLETWGNMVHGRYTPLALTHRFQDIPPPETKTIDIRKEALQPHTFITPTLHTHIQQTLNKGLQTLLFLNRRGYAPLMLCRTCGHRFTCHNCESWLVQHKYTPHNTDVLQCHHCAYTTPTPNDCPACGNTDTLTACGPGVERIFDEVRNTYPTARIFVATAETIKTRRDALEFVNRMQNADIDIVIGTQIIAKGYDFTHLHLVGVIDGDMSLSGTDLRASEYTFQLLHQVAGRTGRHNIRGKAYIQTANPDHPVMQALVSQNRDTFLNMELSMRKITKQPPFHRLVSITLSGRDKHQVDTTAKAFIAIAPTQDGVRFFGPSDPMMAYVRGRHRKRILVNADKAIQIQTILKQWVYGFKAHSSVKIQIDIDPYTFL